MNLRMVKAGKEGECERPQTSETESDKRGKMMSPKRNKFRMVYSKKKRT